MAERPRYLVTLEPVEPWDGPPSTYRLRLALKALLRRHGFTCLGVLPLIEDRTPAPVATLTWDSSGGDAA